MMEAMKCELDIHYNYCERHTIHWFIVFAVKETTLPVQLLSCPLAV